MPLTVGSTAPTQIVQGDTLTWALSSADASPAAGDSLKVRLTSATDTVEVDAVANAGNRDWTITVTDDQTRTLGAGTVKWIARVTYAAGQVQVIDSGLIAVAPVAELGTGGNALTFNARRVALLEAQYAKLAADSLSEYSIGERTAKRRPLEIVGQQLANARAALAMEMNGGRLAGTAVWFGDGC